MANGKRDTLPEMSHSSNGMDADSAELSKAMGSTGLGSTLASTGRTPEPFQQYALSGIMAAKPNEDYPSATISTPQGKRKVQVGQLLDERYGHEITDIYQDRDDKGILQWKMEVTPPEGAGRPFIVPFQGKTAARKSTPTPSRRLIPLPDLSASQIGSLTDEEYSQSVKAGMDKYKDDVDIGKFAFEETYGVSVPMRPAGQSSPDDFQFQVDKSGMTPEQAAKLPDVWNYNQATGRGTGQWKIPE
tara:strand:+ start:918 stop:1652 length:735 start_codon:yes stop_codon:yes gene_type:complete